MKFAFGLHHVMDYLHSPSSHVSELWHEVFYHVTVLIQEFKSIKQMLWGSIEKKKVGNQPIVIVNV